MDSQSLGIIVTVAIASIGALATMFIILVSKIDNLRKDIFDAMEATRKETTEYRHEYVNRIDAMFKTMETDISKIRMDVAILKTSRLRMEPGVNLVE